jgi:hypothetical protein
VITPEKAKVLRIRTSSVERQMERVPSQSEPWSSPDQRYPQLRPIVESILRLVLAGRFQMIQRRIPDSDEMRSRSDGIELMNVKKSITVGNLKLL